MHNLEEDKSIALKNEIRLLKAEIQHLKNCSQGVDNSFLLSNDSYYKALFDEAPLPYQSLNEQGRIITVNSAWLKLFGYHINEVAGCYIGDFLTDESKELLIIRFTAFLEQGCVIGAEYDFICKDGRIVAINVNGRIQNDVNGNFKATHCILSDITLQRKNERLLYELKNLAEENEAKYRLLVEYQNDLVVKVDTEGRFLYVSPSYCRLFAKEEKELIGNSFFPLVHEDDRDSTAKAMEQLKVKPYSCYLEQRAMTSIGWRWLAWNDKAVLDTTGNIIAIVGAGRDITQRKEFEDKLCESENRLLGVLTAINHSVWDWRLDSNEVYFDDRYYRMAGYEPGEFKNNYNEWLKRIHPNDVEGCLQSIKNHLEGVNDIYDFEFRFLKKNGDWLWIRGRGKIMERDADGRPLRMLGTHADITKRKDVEAKLADRDRKMANLMSKIPGVAYRFNIDSQWTMEYLSEGCFGLTGYETDDFIHNKNLAFNDIILPEYRGKLWEELEKDLSATNSFNDEYQIITKDGLKKWVWEQGAFYIGPDGQVDGLEGIILDITERKRAELIHQFQYNVAINLVTTRNVDDLLNVVRDELRRIFDFDGMVVGFLDARHESFQTIYEVDQEPGLHVWPVNKSLSGIVVKEMKGLLFTDESILELFEKGEIDIFGKISKCWMGVPLVYEGNVIGVILVQSFHNTKAYDNTSLQVLEIIASQLSIYIEQKRTLVRSSQLLKGIEQSPVIIVIANKQGIISYVNTCFTETTGYSLGEAIGQNPRFLKSNEHDNAFYDNLWQTILSGNIWEGEFRNIKKNGDVYWEKTIISPLVDDKGEIVQFIAFKEDVTEKKIMMADLVKAKEKAEESDRLKSAFLANLSHEIRTPMNAILGFTELLQDPEITIDIISNYVAIIHRSGYHLLGIINDIIEISKIETGQISPNFSPVNIGTLISDLFETIKITIPDGKNIDLIIDPKNSTIDRIILTDEVKLTQVLTNLITNALKFTDYGSVGFGYVVKNGFLEFSVTDTGIGIDEKNLRLIFDRFYQIESDLRIKSGGSGLGLAISKAYIEMLGGTINVKSKLGIGSTFIFTIPYSE